MDKLLTDNNKSGDSLHQEDSGKSGVSPDHYATESGFVEVFLEDNDLLCEFPLYAREFLKHEGANLEEYQDVDYGVGNPGLNTNGVYLSEKIVSLMYQAAKKGSNYARNMMVYLYKTYYKAEYNRLKRFKILSWQSLSDLAEERVGDGYRIQVRKLARYLCMAPMLNIPLTPDCDDFYSFLADTYYDTRVQIEEKNRFQLPEELLEESRTEVAGWLQENENFRKGKNSRRSFPQWWKAREFACCTLEYFGYARDHITYGNDDLDSDELELNMIKTRAILKKRFKKEPTYEEVQFLAVIFELADKLVDEISTVSDTVDNFLGLSSDYAIVKPEKPRFNLEKLNAAVKNSGSGTGTLKMEAAKVAADQPGTNTEKRKNDKDSKVAKEAQDAKGSEARQLIAEIENLRMKLHNVEKENEHLRENSKKIRELTDTIGILKQQQADDRRELHALREHVYKLTEKDQMSETDVEEMEQAVAEKRIVIIGGIDSWSNRLKAKFRNWKFISTDISALVDLNIFDGADYTYFFTDYLAHRTYVGYVKALRERGMIFGYIHSTNYENNIRQIYGDTCSG